MEAIIVGVNYKQDYNVNESLDELEELCRACNIVVKQRVIQNVDKINPATFIGKGKVIEIKHLLNNDDIVIFDEELSPLQVKNLNDVLGNEVTDRFDLILRIFESRAQTKEAKLQVEIAKYQYLLPRLVGMQEHMSHQQGGSGFRGSGETQIELDRRKIRSRLNQARKELNEIVKQRQTQRKRRRNNNVRVIALVGYTNSGKSSLMNALTDDESKVVYQEDMLFATLQTATRRIKINNHECLLTDTVGFIDRLPHTLVKAFASTLEEVKEADLLVHVIDASNEKYARNIQITNQVLKEIGVKDIPMIYAYNKIDLNMHYTVVPTDPYVFMSVKENRGLDKLEEMISKELFKEYAIYDFNIPYDKGEVFNYLQQNSLVLELQYLDDSIYMKVECHPKVMVKCEEYKLKH